MNNQFYSTALNKHVYVHFEIIAALGDQPERRQINYLSNGNGLYSARYGHSCNINAISDILPSCIDCDKIIRSNKCVIQRSCNQCLRWDIMSNQSLCFTEPPNGYPTNKLEGNHKLRPRKLDWLMLIEAIDETSNSYITKIWTRKNCYAYLNIFGISNRGVEKVLYHCDNVLALKKAKNNELDKIETSLLYDHARRNPSEFQKWEGGPYWKSTINIKSFIDVVMHLLFLGITKSCKDLISEALDNDQSTILIRKKRAQLYNVMKEWGLCWMQLLDSSSGWVSENYLGFCRIIKWYYCSDILLKTEQNCSEIKDTKLSIIGNLTSSLYAMVGLIMSELVNQTVISYTDRVIRIFLSNLRNYETYSKRNKHGKLKDKKKPIWITKYNYQSLMNIPEQMQLFGPLVQLWEGSNQGEGYLRFIKPKINNVHAKNWHINAHKRLLEEISLDRIIDRYTDKRTEGDQEHEYRPMKHLRERRQKTKYHTYDSIRDIKSAIETFQPISCIRNCGNEYMVVVAQKERNVRLGVPININFAEWCALLQMNLHNITMNQCGDVEMLQEIKEESIINYLACLPVIDHNFSDGKCNKWNYYIIDSRWKEVNRMNDITIAQSN